MPAVNRFVDPTPKSQDDASRVLLRHLLGGRNGLPRRLKAFGVAVFVAGIGKSRIGALKGQTDSGCVAGMRADTDALPSVEVTGRTLSRPMASCMLRSSRLCGEAEIQRHGDRHLSAGRGTWRWRADDQ
ncbi:hypothetical protein IVB30_32175 [Bradyrhizobium sp. 200]|nr:hypothetical protein IVB30_32175 [Bradyrhizobium sp. 200]